MRFSYGLYTLFAWMCIRYRLNTCMRLWHDLNAFHTWLDIRYKLNAFLRFWYNLNTFHSWLRIWYRLNAFLQFWYDLNIYLAWLLIWGILHTFMRRLRTPLTSSQSKGVCSIAWRSSPRSEQSLGGRDEDLTLGRGLVLCDTKHSTNIRPYHTDFSYPMPYSKITSNSRNIIHKLIYYYNKC